MILRKPAEHTEASEEPRSDPFAEASGPEGSWASRTPLRWRLSMVTGAVVAISVAVITLATYWTVSTSLTASVDRELDQKADALLRHVSDPRFSNDMEEEISRFKTFNPGVRVSASPESWAFGYGDTIPVGGDFTDSGNNTETSIRKLGDERVLAKRNSDGAVVLLAKNMTDTNMLITSLGTILLIILSVGFLLAILAGMLVSKTGLQPIQRLKRAADYVTQTDDLRPIAVVGNDEMAQLTRSFNEMLEALQESRIRQAQFVADAGHELKTPLTSMRTNIELLMMITKSDSPMGISEDDRKELEHDVKTQMTEMTTLVGDLVDLAREDATEKDFEPIELHKVMESSLKRVRLRRQDVDFRVNLIPWELPGDQFALGRATLNIMDNAAKWSPATGTVRVSMKQIDPNHVRLRVDDSGPGIPPEEREKVFERFYRSAEARAMPGSGLGLAICKQVVLRHEGTIQISESRDKGTRMEIILPGHPVDDVIPPELTVGDQDGSADRAGNLKDNASDERKQIFAERWFNQA